MLIMLSVPLLEGVAFWLILRRPNAIFTTPETPENQQYEGQSTDTLSTFDNIILEKGEDIEKNEKSNECDTPFGLKEKIMYLPSLLKYMIPITLVYFLEYFINQGLVSFV